MGRFTGIILAGGKSSRMKTDKGLLEINEKPMVLHQIELLGEFCNEIIISSNQEPYRDFGFKVVPDEIIGIGPLGGLYTALKASNNPTCVVLSCDVPFVSETVLKLLVSNFTKHDAALVSQWEDQIHPLVGIYSKDIVLEEAIKMIEEKNFKLRQLLKRIGASYINFHDQEDVSEEAFMNINTPDEFEKAIQILSKKE